MPDLGYQDFLLPKKLQEDGNRTVIITSDRYTPIDNYESTWGKIMGPRIQSNGDFKIDGLLVKRLSPVFELQRRILLKGLYGHLKKLKPEYIFVHNILSMNIPIALAYAKKYKVPIFVDSHLTFTSSKTTIAGRLYYWLIRKYYQKNQSNFSGFFGVAKECLDHMEQFIGIKKEISELLPIGIDEKVFKFNNDHRKKVRAEFNIKEDEILIMQTGKLSQEKGVQLIPEILKNLDINLLKKIRILFVGDGDTKFLNEVLHKPLKKMNFQSYEVIGFVDYKSLPKYYCAADFVLYPLASSLSALEAAACRSVVFMSSTDASKWRAKKGVGFSIDFNNLDNASETLNKYFSLNKEKIEKLKKSAEKSVYDSFSYMEIGRSFISKQIHIKNKFKN